MPPFVKGAFSQPGQQELPMPTMEADTEGPWQGWSKPLEGKPLLSGHGLRGQVLALGLCL